MGERGVYEIGKVMSKRKRKARLLIVLTAINILLFIGSIFSLIRTSKTIKFINSFCGDFNCREEGKGEIILTLRSGKEMNLRFEKSSVKVVGATTRANVKNAYVT